MTFLFEKSLDEDINFLSAVWSQLNSDTANISAEMRGEKCQPYNPWHCLQMASKKPIENPLLTSMDYEKGSLITDPYQLNEMQELLTQQGKDITADIPVPPEEWPVMIDIARHRPDAISSFLEGRALLKASPFLDELYTNLIEFVVPLDREKPSGYDSNLARGVIFRTFPRGRTGLLAGFQLAHGLGHQVGMSLFSIDTIFKSDPKALIFYEVRHDKRTANHAFISTVALAFMTMFSHAIYGKGNNPYIEDEHVAGYAEYLPDALDAAIRSIEYSCELTDFGQQTMKGLSSLL